MSAVRLAVFLLPCASLAVSALSLAEPVAIVGAAVHTMTTREPLRAATIVIRDGRIDAVGAGIAIPADARRIEARGRVVTPAFLNSATQLGLTEVSSVDATNDASVSSGTLGAGFDIQYAFNRNSLAVAQARADGLSRAIAFPTGSAGAPFAGMGALLHLTSHDAVLERTQAAMFAEVGGQASAGVGGSRSAQWQLIRNALDEAKAFKPGSGNGPRDSALHRADLVALKQVAEGRMPLVIEANRESDIRQAIALARDYRLKVILKGALEAWRVADALAAANIPVILDPTINLPLYFDHVGVRADNATLLDRAGVRIALHASFSIYTTYNAAFALREVAGVAVANGLDHHAALAALTTNPAAVWGVNDRYGTIAPGRDADLLIWDGDPFEPLTTLVGVILQGQDVSMHTRQTALRDRYKPGTSTSPLPPAYENQ
jgi:imidazolonepropionase-like amidohydrolase